MTAIVPIISDQWTKNNFKTIKIVYVDDGNDDDDDDDRARFRLLICVVNTTTFSSTIYRFE